MAEYKVVIPSAGLGTRLDKYTKYFNKALVPINHKPSIAYIIEKFPIDIELVICLGYKGRLLKDFLTLVYPERKFNFVQIDNFSGPSSGLGHTLLCAKEQLQCPFVFCSNDTLVEENIVVGDENWVGYSENSKNLDDYRTLVVSSNALLDKKSYHQDQKAYIGLAYIKDYEDFWHGIEDNINYGSVALGEVAGLKKIHFKPKQFTWYDVGNKKILEELNKKKKYNILPKENEEIWFVNNKVVKFFDDNTIVGLRVNRNKILKEFVPQLCGSRVNLYAYKQIEGNTLSTIINKKLFNNLLSFLEVLWESYNGIENYVTFYKEKTEDRVEKYFSKYPLDKKIEYINEEKVLPIYGLLNKIGWSQLSLGTKHRIHGDLHFENILLSEAGKFVLLDWRQDFDGHLGFGDIYYDFAKLMHGLIVSHNSIYNNHFTVDDKFDDRIDIDVLRPQKLVEIEKIFNNYLKNKDWDLHKVHILTGLIFINNAPLHHYPYDKFLFNFGHYYLQNTIVGLSD